MAALHSSSLAPFCLKKLILIPHPKPRRIYRFQAMSSSSGPGPAALVHKVPGLDPDYEMERVADQTFRRYTSSSSVKRNGNGVAIVWFRNDLRVLDNEALYKAWLSSQQVLPVYCVDPRLFGSTYYFGFPKTGGTNFPPLNFLVFEIYSLASHFPGIDVKTFRIYLCVVISVWHRIMYTENLCNFGVRQRWERNFSSNPWPTWRRI